MSNTTPGVTTDTLFALIPEWVLYHADISAQAIRLYGALSRHADQGGASHPSKRRLAALCHCSVSSVERAIRELVDIGALEVRKRNRDDGSTASNGYFLRRGGVTRDEGGHVTRDDSPHVTRDVGMNENHDEREPSERNTLPAAPVDAPEYDPIEGRRVEKQDLVWNALAGVIDTDEPPHGSRMRAACRTVRTVVWEFTVTAVGEDRARMLANRDPESYERTVADTVPAVNRWLRDQSPGLTFGPEGFARNFRRGLIALASGQTTTRIVEEALRDAPAG